jgi:adenosine/AMP kinase
MNYQKDSTHKWNLSILPSVHLEDMVVKLTAASKNSLIVVVCKLENSSNCFHGMPIIYVCNNK